MIILLDLRNLLEKMLDLGKEKTWWRFLNKFVVFSSCFAIVSKEKCDIFWGFSNCFWISNFMIFMNLNHVFILRFGHK